MLASLHVTLLLLIGVNNNPNGTQNDIKLLEYVKSQDTDVSSIIMLDEWFRGRKCKKPGTRGSLSPKITYCPPSDAHAKFGRSGNVILKLR